VRDVAIDTLPAASAVLPAWTAAPGLPGILRLGAVAGQGIGPEVIAAALHVLAAAAAAHDLAVDVVESGPIGADGPDGFAVDGAAAKYYDAAFAAGMPVLTGPAGGRFVYDLRARYDLFAKLVPVRPTPALADASIVRPDRVRGADVLVVRDNIGGLYQGRFGRRDGGRVAFQDATYRLADVERLLAVAHRAAHRRRGRLAVVVKPGGIPAISALWRDAADAVCGPGVEVEVIEVDNACYQLVADPHRFDVVAAPNLLGDVVADTAALVLGSRGLSYSANFGDGARSVYQTGHGAAHDLAGTDRANPIAQMRAAAWLVRDSLGRADVAATIEAAIVATLATGLRTPDIAAPGSTVVGTAELAARIADRAHAVAAAAS